MTRFQEGQRVELADIGNMGKMLKDKQRGEQATILRCVERAGETRYLVRFDKADAMYGMYWLSSKYLQEPETPGPA